MPLEFFSPKYMTQPAEGLPGANATRKFAARKPILLIKPTNVSHSFSILIPTTVMMIPPTTPSNPSVVTNVEYACSFH